MQNITDLDIKTVIEDFTGLKFKGNVLQYCPFCNSGKNKNNTSAFSIKNNFFKCFSCEKKGNVIDFVKEYEKVDFKAAINIISKKYNINIEHSKKNSNMTDWEKKIFAIKQNSKKTAINYLEDIRKIDTNKIPENSFYYDEYSNAIVFFDDNLKLINKRFIDKEKTPKSINEKGSEIKNATYTLIQNNNELFFVEGCINALSLYTLEKNSIAIFSTSNLFDDEYLLKYENKDIVLAFDNDPAGKKATEYYLKKFYKVAKTLKILTVPEKKDVNDLLKENKLSVFLADTDNFEYVKAPVSEIPLKNTVPDIEFFEKINDFYFNKSKYYYINRKNTEIHVNISDCIFKFLYRIISTSENTKHLIKVQGYIKDDLKIRIIEADTDEIQKDKFEKKLNNIGFSYFGTTLIFNKIKMFNLHNEKECIKVEKYGFYNDYFFWSNVGVCIKNKEVLFPNELGIIETEKISYYLEASSLANINNKNYNEIKKFHYKSGQLNFYEFTNLFWAAYNKNSIIGICYLVASLFRDIIFNQIGRFPNLYLYGEAGTGKSAFVEFLLAVQGDYTGGYSLMDTTQPSFSRIVNGRTNTLIYFKEYNEGLQSFVDEFIKTAYEGQGRTISTMSNGNEVISYQALNGMIFDANFLPINQEAVFSRMIIIDFNNKKFSNEQKEAFDILEREKKEGLSQISVEILAYRQEFENFFCSEYQNILKRIKEKNQNSNSRLLVHSALITTIFEFLCPILKLENIKKEMYDYIIDIIQKHEQRQETFDHSKLFWEAFAIGIKNNIIKDINSQTIKMPNMAYYRIKDNEILGLKSSDFKVYTQLYAKYCRDLNIKPLSPNLIKESLINKNYFVKNDTQKSRNTEITHTDKYLGSALYFRYLRNNHGLMMINNIEIETIDI